MTASLQRSNLYIAVIEYSQSAIENIVTSLVQATFFKLSFTV